MKHVIVILDLGTTNIKATVMGEHGETVSVKTLSTPVLYGKDSMEIDPERLWQTVLDCCRGALTSCNETMHVQAVSLSSMAASFIPMDEHGKCLYHAIGWSDARCLPYMHNYMQAFLAGRQIEHCGQYPLPMYAGFKMQWLQAHYPEVFHATKKWLNVSEFIYHRLVGSSDLFVTDFSIASRTMLFDVTKQDWNPAALDYFHVDSTWLPRPLPAGTVVGTVGPEGIEAGLSSDTKVVLGGHDHMCAVAGAGITQTGIILNSTGTSEAVECLVPDDSEPEKMAARWINLECAVLPGKTAAVYYVGATGRVYQSACETMRDYDLSVYPYPGENPIFLPPQRAQLPSVKGQLIGMSPVFDAQQMTRAIRDGMYYECKRGIQRILGKNTSQDVTIRCVGGHTKNRYEMQLKSDATGCVIELARKEDIASKGAFILASVGCGWYDSIQETADLLYQKVEREYVIPDSERSKRYEEIYQNNYLTQFADGIQSL